MKLLENFMALKPEKNATKGKGDYPNGNTRDNSKTHLKSGGGRNSGRGNNGGRR